MVSYNIVIAYHETDLIENELLANLSLKLFYLSLNIGRLVVVLLEASLEVLLVKMSNLKVLLTGATGYMYDFIS